MSGWLRFWRRIPLWVTDLLVVAIAAGDVALFYESSEGPLSLAGCILACAALLIRRRWPLIAFLLTLPAAYFSVVLVAPIIALFSLARSTRRRWILFVCGALFAAAESIEWPFSIDASWTGVTFLYQLATAAAPIFLGQLMQATADLQARITEIEATKQHERDLYAQSMLTQERNQLAREMHDVVSHQVSLISVQAAALQVTTSDPEVRTAASSIRTMAATTLDELRSMVMLLRAAGTRSPGLAPQPTVADLDDLITSSGLPVSTAGELPDDLPSATQRAVYRVVQEALTNVRKHAPGSTVRIELLSDDESCGVIVENGPATASPLNLPGAKLGLLGLRERAELLGGTLEAGPGDAGFAVRLSLPRSLV